MAKKKCSITLSQACEGMILSKQAEGKSPHTISDYRNTFKKFKLYFKSDPLIDTITKADMVSFFGWLQEDYVSEPDGVAYRGKTKLSPKSVLNIHTNLSSLWRWAMDEKLVRSNIVREIQMTKPSDPVIIFNLLIY